MAAVSQADIRLCGSHAGVEIGQDGPSQMGLEDLAAMRAVHGSTVLYPSDANSAAALTAAMADLDRRELPAHHARRLPGAVRRRTRRSRSAAPRSCACPTTTTCCSPAPA